MNDKKIRKGRLGVWAINTKFPLRVGTEEKSGKMWGTLCWIMKGMMRVNSYFGSFIRMWRKGRTREPGIYEFAIACCIHDVVVVVSILIFCFGVMRVVFESDFHEKATSSPFLSLTARHKRSSDSILPFVLLLIWDNLERDKGSRWRATLKNSSFGRCTTFISSMDINKW